MALFYKKKRKFEHVFISSMEWWSKFTRVCVTATSCFTFLYQLRTLILTIFFLLTKWNFYIGHYHRKINSKQFFVKKWTKVASIEQLGKILCAEATIAANTNVFPVVDYENRKCVCVRNFALQKWMLYNSHSFDKFCKKFSNTFFVCLFAYFFWKIIFGEFIWFTKLIRERQLV